MYHKIDNEMKEKYKKFTGIDVDDITIKIFSRDEQIERYSKNLAFWILETPNIESIENLSENQEEFMRSYYVSNAKSLLTRKINENFDDEMIAEIYEKAYKIANVKVDPKILRC